MSDSTRTSRRKSASVPNQEAWNYEITVAKVEAIVNKIESGEMELASVFEEFNAAIEYLRQCENFLAQKRQQMNLVIHTLAEETESF